MAHPATTKGFSRLSPKRAMLPRLSAETHPPPPVPQSLLAQSLSPKDIARSLTSLMKVSCRIYPATSGKGLNANLTHSNVTVAVMCTRDTMFSAIISVAY